MKKLFAFVTALFFAFPVSAETLNCIPYNNAVSELYNKFGETLTTILYNYNDQIHIFENSDTETWTILYIREKTACIMASGTGTE